MWNLPGQPGTAAGKPGNPPISPFATWPGERRRPNLGHRHGSRRQSLRRRAQHGSQRQKRRLLTIKYFVRTDKPRGAGNGRYNGRERHRPGLRVRDMERPASGRQYIFRDPDTGEDYVAVTETASASGPQGSRSTPRSYMTALSACGGSRGTTGRRTICQDKHWLAVASRGPPSRRPPPLRDRSQRSISRLRNSTMPQVVLDRENASRLPSADHSKSWMRRHLQQPGPVAHAGLRHRRRADLDVCSRDD